jgi:hypothetical protein
MLDPCLVIKAINYISYKKVAFKPDHQAHGHINSIVVITCPYLVDVCMLASKTTFPIGVAKLYVQMISFGISERYQMVFNEECDGFVA